MSILRLHSYNLQVFELFRKNFHMFTTAIVGDKRCEATRYRAHGAL